MIFLMILSIPFVLLGLFVYLRNALPVFTALMAGSITSVFLDGYHITENLETISVAVSFVVYVFVAALIEESTTVTDRPRYDYDADKRPE
jgi:hypothetical protein